MTNQPHFADADHAACFTQVEVLARLQPADLRRGRAERNEHRGALTGEGEFLLIEFVLGLSLAAIAVKQRLKPGEDGRAPPALLGGQELEIDFDVTHAFSHEGTHRARFGGHGKRGFVTM